MQCLSQPTLWKGNQKETHHFVGPWHPDCQTHPLLPHRMAHSPLRTSRTPTDVCRSALVSRLFFRQIRFGTGGGEVRRVVFRFFHLDWHEFNGLGPTPQVPQDTLPATGHEMPASKARRLGFVAFSLGGLFCFCLVVFAAVFFCWFVGLFLLLFFIFRGGLRLFWEIHIPFAEMNGFFFPLVFFGNPSLLGIFFILSSGLQQMEVQFPSFPAGGVSQEFGVPWTFALSTKSAR